jgi:isoleucyl-tRNA synthetase
LCRLSRFYFESAKRRLYFLDPDCLERRSSQTALEEILDVLTRLLAPITSFLAEEVPTSPIKVTMINKK